MDRIWEWFGGDGLQHKLLQPGENKHRCIARRRRPSSMLGLRGETEVGNWT